MKHILLGAITIILVALLWISNTKQDFSPQGVLFWKGFSRLLPIQSAFLLWTKGGILLAPWLLHSVKEKAVIIYQKGAETYACYQHEQRKKTFVNQSLEDYEGNQLIYTPFELQKYAPKYSPSTLVFGAKKVLHALLALGLIYIMVYTTEMPFYVATTVLLILFYSEIVNIFEIINTQRTWKTLKVPR